MLSERPLRIFIIAGEPSGDNLAAKFVQAFKRLKPNTEFSGVGGPGMEEAGVDLIFGIDELTVMGIIEVLPRIPRILARISQATAAIRRLQPDVLLTVDAPDFSLRVARRVRGMGVRVVHYVAPSVWAWRPGRAKRLAGQVDHLLALLPFEPPFFEAVGLPTSFVGHPAVEHEIDQTEGARFRQAHKIGDEVPLLAVLPGSRLSEIRRLMPVMGPTVAMVQQTNPALEIVVPTLAHLREVIEPTVKSWPVPSRIVVGATEKAAAFAASNAALACSGTVALELALAHVPVVITYRVSPLTAEIVRRVVRVRYVNLVNLVLNKAVVPEFLQENCRPDLLAAAISRLLSDASARAEQIDATRQVVDLLGGSGIPPSQRAAEVVLRLATGRPP